MSKTKTTTNSFINSIKLFKIMTKKLLTFLTLLTLFFGVGWAAEETMTFVVTGRSTGTFTGAPTGATASIVTYGNGSGSYQIQKDAYKLLTISNMPSSASIKGVKVRITRSGNGTTGTVEVKMDDISIGTLSLKKANVTQNSSSASSADDKVVPITETSFSGDLTIKVTSDASSYYVWQFEITYETGDTPQPTSYNLTGTGDNGSVTFAVGGATVTSAAAGATVTATATANTGYEFSSWTQPSNVTNWSASGNTASFTMPSEDVTVNATFTESSSGGNAGPMIYTPSSSNSGTLTGAPTSSVTASIAGFSGFTTGQGAQRTAANDPATITFSNLPTNYKVTKIEVEYCTNKSAGVGTISATLNGNAIGDSFDASYVSGDGRDLKTATLYNNAAGTVFNGSLVVSTHVTTNSIYIYKVLVYYEEEVAGAYSIETVCTPTVGGSINCSKSSSNGNEEISFTVSTNDNYEFAYVEVKDANNNAVNVTESNGTYSFTMPTSDVTITAHFNQAGTLYILGEANGKFDNADWQPNEGTLMTYSNGKYTARVYFKGYTKYNDGDGFSEFAFSKKLATKTAANGGWDEINWDGSRYGSGAEGSYWGIGGQNQSAFGSTIPLYNHSQKSYRVPAGVYDIEVDLKTYPNTVKVTPVDLSVTLDPASGTFNKGKEITISSNLTSIVAATGSNETVLIQHKIGDGEFVNGSTAILNTVGENIAVIGKASIGHIVVADTSTYTIENKYAVTVASGITNGTVKVNGANEVFVEPGEEVTITATPSTGYSLGTITVTDANNNPITVTNGKFIMPESNVTVSATFAVNSYGITVVNTNCSVDVASTANYNSQVTFTVTPRSDKYEVSTVTVTYGDGRTKPVTDNGDGTYSFYMPDDNVTLTVVCTRKSTGGNQFTLVKSQTDIVAGGEYVILNAAETQAMTKTSSNNYDDYSTQYNLDGEIVTLTEGSDVSILKFIDGSTTGTFKIQDGNLYLTAANKKLNATANGSDWTVTLGNNNNVTIQSGEWIIRNNSNYFRCYSTSTGSLVKLYKRLPAGVSVEIDPTTGSVIGSQVVNIGSDTDGALVQYKVEKQNGSNWDVVTDWTEWTTYTEANGPVEFTITGNVGDVYQVTARAKEAGQEVEPDEEEDFDEQTVQYTFVAPNAPVITPASCSITSETQSVTITSDYANGTIEYSTDGGTTWEPYNGKFNVVVEGMGESVTVQARVTVNGVTSESASATYTRSVQPVVFSPASGTYYGDQTCQMFSTTKGARIYYTTDGSDPVMNQATTQLYTGEVAMTEGNTYNFKARAYIGTTASEITTASYVIKPRSEATGYNNNYLLFSVAELNAVELSSSNRVTDYRYTMVNPVQVVWMSTYLNNGYYPEYCLIRDNTGYGMLYFGYRNSSHAGDAIFNMGDWIKGGYNGYISLAWSSQHGQLDTHPEMGTSGSGIKIYNWSENLYMSNAAVLPEYLSIPEILASGTTGNTDYWGHYVHMRKNTISLTSKDEDGKWSGMITDENDNQIAYYDKFYLQSDSTSWTTTNNYFTGHPRRTFDVYGFVACHLPADIDYQIAPFAFAWIDQPVCDHETGTYTTEQTVALSSPDDPTATIWYKTDDMDDYHVYTEPFTVNSTTTVSWYATKQSQYNDELESKKGTITMTFATINPPVIAPESQVKAVGSESVNSTITRDNSDGLTATIWFTIDGSDPSDPSSDRYEYNTTNQATMLSDIRTTTTVRAIAEVDGIYSAEAEARTYTFVKSNGIVYDLVTSVSQLNENGVYVIVSQNYSEALSTTQNTTNRGAAGVLFVEDTNKAKVYGNDDVAQFTLTVLTHDEDTSPERHFLMQTNNSSQNGYLYVGSESNNTLLTEANEDAMGNDVAVITIDADGRAHIHFNYAGGDNRYLQYWNRDRLFNTYKTEYADRAVYIYGVNATPLATIEKEGTALPTTTTAENQYTIADQLIAVHYKDAQNDAGEHYLWCKDQGNVSISKTEKTGDDQIDYLKDVTKVQNGDWDQSNWVVLKFTNPTNVETISGAVGKYINPASITGHYTDCVNFTITLPNGADLVGKVGDKADFTPNVYCPVNFLDKNLNIGGGQGPVGAETGEHYFFMNPKIQEVATVTYAVWNGTCFVIPAKAGGNNQGDFDGAFSVAWTYNAYGDQKDNLQAKTAYRFTAVLNTVDAKLNSYANTGAKAGENAAGTVEGKEVEPQAGKVVYALDLNGGTGSDNIITAIQDVADGTGKAVAGVKYYNLAGIESDRPFEGVNIVVTTYTDGSRSSSKVLK